MELTDGNYNDVALCWLAHEWSYCAHTCFAECIVCPVWTTVVVASQLLLVTAIERLTESTLDIPSELSVAA